MTKPSQFSNSSDYSSIGSDSSPTLSITIPNSISIASGTTWSTETTATITDISYGKGIIANVRHSKNGSFYYGNTLFMIETGSSPSGASYYILIQIYRKSRTTVAMKVSIFNSLFPSATLITNSNGGVITAEVSTTVLA